MHALFVFMKCWKKVFGHKFETYYCAKNRSSLSKWNLFSAVTNIDPLAACALFHQAIQTWVFQQDHVPCNTSEYKSTFLFWLINNRQQHVFSLFVCLWCVTSLLKRTQNIGQIFNEDNWDWSVDLLIGSTLIFEFSVSVFCPRVVSGNRNVRLCSLYEKWSVGAYKDVCRDQVLRCHLCVWWGGRGELCSQWFVFLVTSAQTSFHPQNSHSLFNWSLKTEQIDRPFIQEVYTGFTLISYIANDSHLIELKKLLIDSVTHIQFFCFFFCFFLFWATKKQKSRALIFKF